ELREVLALEILHRNELRAILERAEIDDARHVIAADLRDGTRLTLEARHRVLVLERLGTQDFYRDTLPIIDARRDDDDAHPARAQRAFDAIFAGDQRAIREFGRLTRRTASACLGGIDPILGATLVHESSVPK